MMIRRRTALALLACVIAGCARIVQPEPAMRGSPAPAGQIRTHGVIDLPCYPGPPCSGIQGSEPLPQLIADDAARFQLVLEPDFALLGAPDSEGRGVTVTGTLVPIEIQPLGVVGEGLRITDYRFDSP